MFKKTYGSKSDQRKKQKVDAQTHALIGFESHNV